MLCSRVPAWLTRTLSDDPVEKEMTGVIINGTGEKIGSQRSEMKDAATLAQTTLFRHLDLFQLSNLIANATEQTFPAGHAMLR